MGRARRMRPKHLGRKLKAIRERLGVTQPGLCHKLGFPTVQPPQISEYEHGKREPPYPVLLRYAQIAQCSTDFLMDDNREIPDRY